MGDCDRMKKYILDYLDGTLDPTIKEEFERVLNESTQLQKLTSQVAQIPTMMGSLSRYSCSEDFSIRLRQRLNTAEKPMSKHIVRRYSFAFSFVVLAIIIFWGVNGIWAPSEPIQQVTKPQLQDSYRINNASSGAPVNSMVDSDEMNIKTREENTLADSTRQEPPLQQSKKPGVKYVDQKK